MHGIGETLEGREKGKYEDGKLRLMREKETHEHLEIKGGSTSVDLSRSTIVSICRPPLLLLVSFWNCSYEFLNFHVVYFIYYLYVLILNTFLVDLMKTRSEIA